MGKTNRSWWEVLIAPFWYWNGAGCRGRRDLVPGFNRTFLVLKLMITMYVQCPICGFNRTFLVLKCRSYRFERRPGEVLIAPFWYWNRAEARVVQLHARSVLIAPFWYWNDSNGRSFSSAQSRFNRTFLVLKLDYEFNTFAAVNSFNRTFLVLKSLRFVSALITFLSFNRTFLVLKSSYTVQETPPVFKVLIAPFWYWNRSRFLNIVFTFSVLIAPFWYWNCTTCQTPCRQARAF